MTTLSSAVVLNLQSPSSKMPAIGGGALGRIGRFFNARGPRRQVRAASISLRSSPRHSEEEDAPLPTFNRYRDFDSELASDRSSEDDGYDPVDFAKRHLNARHRRRRFSHCFRRRVMMWLILLLALIGGWGVYKYRAEKALKARWRPDSDTIKFSKGPLGPPPEHINITNFELPLRTRGRDVVDAQGKRFKLASVNWYGASDELFVVGGLNVKHRSEIAETIKRLGFNSVRLPYADELVTANPKVDPKLLSKNPDLIGKTAMEVFEATTNALTDAGIAVIINNHITSATWCCGADPCDAGWANDHLGPICRLKQTEEDWIQNWEKIMLPYLDNPLVIGCDLRNEVRGLWGTMPWSKWAAAAENAGNRLLKMNPDWLIVVEGTESANDLSGARKRPVVLDVPDKLVYSAHVYGWSGWGSLGGRFVQRTYESFVSTMRYNWGYLLEQDIAPVWLGELGASHSPGLGSRNYWGNLFRYMKELDADFGYWALNPRKPRRSAPESYALVKDDYTTPILDYRMKDMVELMWQQEGSQ